MYIQQTDVLPAPDVVPLEKPWSVWYNRFKFSLAISKGFEFSWMATFTIHATTLAINLWLIHLQSGTTLFLHRIFAVINHNIFKVWCATTTSPFTANVSCCTSYLQVIVEKLVCLCLHNNPGHQPHYLLKHHCFHHVVASTYVIVCIFSGDSTVEKKWQKSGPEWHRLV